jgi:hypothetical protein
MGETKEESPADEEGEEDAAAEFDQIHAQIRTMLLLGGFAMTSNFGSLQEQEGSSIVRTTSRLFESTTAVLDKGISHLCN